MEWKTFVKYAVKVNGVFVSYMNDYSDLYIPVYETVDEALRYANQYENSEIVEVEVKILI